MVLKGPGVCVFGGLVGLSPLSSQSLSQLDIFRHDCHPLCVYSAKIGVFEDPDHVGLSCFLESNDASAVNLHSPLLKFWANSHTNRWNGNFLVRSSVDFWCLLISRRATVPGLYQCGFLTPPVAATAALFLAAAAVLID